MTHISAPQPRGKVNINKFRDECRKWVNESPLSGSQKLVLCRLADYVNSENLIAWPSFDTLAADTGLGKRTVIRAINSAKKLGVVRRLYKGGRLNGRGKSNAYLFPLHERHSAKLAPCHQNHADNADSDDDNTVPNTTSHSAKYGATQCQSDTLSSNDLLKDNLIERDSSAFGVAHTFEESSEKGVGEEEETSSPPLDNQISEQADISEKESGGGTEAPAAASDSPMGEPASRPKQDGAESSAQMAANGMSVRLSRRRRPVEIYPAPQFGPMPVPDDKPIPVSQSLIDSIHKKNSAAI
jgi:Helix-turn-helix domain